jgi:nucleoside 2-deoxyribosyltransferase
MSKKGILFESRALSIGAMEKNRDGGLNFRNRVHDELSPLGIKCWNHYNSPIHCSISEGDDELFLRLKTFKENGQFDEIAKYKQIRNNDLALIDKCDFVICQLDMDVLSCGTWEELFLAIKLCKPVFLYCVQGKKSLPLWIFWSLKLEYVYNDLDEILETIKKIDSEEIEINMNKWKLLTPENR